MPQTCVDSCYLSAGCKKLASVVPQRLIAELARALAVTCKSHIDPLFPCCCRVQEANVNSRIDAANAELARALALTF
jgi:hypothetical protein